MITFSVSSELIHLVKYRLFANSIVYEFVFDLARESQGINVVIKTNISTYPAVASSKSSNKFGIRSFITLYRFF
jgi:hypothetical protein